VDPYGRDKPSPIPRPPAGGGEWVPEYRPPGIPPWLRPIPINTRDTLAVLRGYLNAREPKVARWLYSTWDAEREALKYQEIRNALRDAEVPLEWLMRWQQDYSRFVTEVLDPEWRAAMASAGQAMAENIRDFAFGPTGERMRVWIETRAGELAVALTDAQHQAIRALVRHFALEEPVTVDELAQVLRPVIGLTPKQAEAVRRFRASLLAEGMDRRSVTHQVANYAGYLHRLRAIRIARTELAFAYNFGQLEAIRQAQEQGRFGGPVVKEWMTADDERVCEFCGPMDGVVIELEDTFPGATDKLPSTYVPPAHPMCRCTVGYRVMR